jgi:hypothetical protein
MLKISFWGGVQFVLVFFLPIKTTRATKFSMVWLQQTFLVFSYFFSFSALMFVLLCNFFKSSLELFFPFDLVPNLLVNICFILNN